MVDEWGTWYDVEEGTNPGFLYQQNTMRDAMVAALSLNAFNQHASRVHMANIAQLANVLQAVILTEGENMVLTPTYHVFDLYKVHQGASLVHSAAIAPQMDNGVRQLSHSASIDESGAVHVTIANLSDTDGADVALYFDQCALQLQEGYLLAGDAHAHNTFAAPQAVRPEAFDRVEAQAAPRGHQREILPAALLRRAVELRLRCPFSAAKSSAGAALRKSCPSRNCCAIWMNTYLPCPKKCAPATKPMPAAWPPAPFAHTARAIPARCAAAMCRRARPSAPWPARFPARPAGGQKILDARPSAGQRWRPAQNSGTAAAQA